MSSISPHDSPSDLELRISHTSWDHWEGRRPVVILDKKDVFAADTNPIYDLSGHARLLLIAFSESVLTSTIQRRLFTGCRGMLKCQPVIMYKCHYRELLLYVENVFFFGGW